MTVSPKAKQSVTLDNGLEFAEHEQLTGSVGIKVFFADPYRSCQRGTNENTNGLFAALPAQKAPALKTSTKRNWMTL